MVQRSAACTQTGPMSAKGVWLGRCTGRQAGTACSCTGQCSAHSPKPLLRGCACANSPKPLNDCMPAHRRTRASGRDSWLYRPTWRQPSYCSTFSKLKCWLSRVSARPARTAWLGIWPACGLRSTLRCAASHVSGGCYAGIAAQPAWGQVPLASPPNAHAPWANFTPPLLPVCRQVPGSAQGHVCCSRRLDAHLRAGRLARPLAPTNLPLPGPRRRRREQQRQQRVPCGGRCGRGCWGPGGVRRRAGAVPAAAQPPGAAGGGQGHRPGQGGGGEGQQQRVGQLLLRAREAAYDGLPRPRVQR